jgi:hypothetical protein
MVSMIREMMGMTGRMSLAMGLVPLLLLIFLVLGIAALVKYLFFSNGAGVSK